MVKVKICGITNIVDAEASVESGADALGFNFYKKSPRFITAEAAGTIISELSGRVINVGVFVNSSVNDVLEIARTAGLDAIQLHGDEDGEYIGDLKEKCELEIIKAFRVGLNFTVQDVIGSKADSILLDTYSKDGFGGTGTHFDWQTAVKVRDLVPRLYLAGGLSSANIIDAVETVRPFAVDACSLLESEKGKKDLNAVRDFIQNAKSADSSASV